MQILCRSGQEFMYILEDEEELMDNPYGIFKLLGTGYPSRLQLRIGQ